MKQVSTAPKSDGNITFWVGAENIGANKLTVKAMDLEVDTISWPRPTRSRRASSISSATQHLLPLLADRGGRKACPNAGVDDAWRFERDHETIDRA